CRPRITTARAGDDREPREGRSPLESDRHLRGGHPAPGGAPRDARARIQARGVAPPGPATTARLVGRRPGGCRDAPPSRGRSRALLRPALVCLGDRSDRPAPGRAAARDRGPAGAHRHAHLHRVLGGRDRSVLRRGGERPRNQAGRARRPDSRDRVSPGRLGHRVRGLLLPGRSRQVSVRRTVRARPVRLVTSTDLCFTSAVDLGALVRTGRLSPVELCEAALTRVERLNRRLNAFLTITPDLARAQARAAEARARTGALRGPLDGIPYTLKDLEPTAEVRTTFGSKWFANYVPPESGLVATRLAAAGGVLLGKTNTPQFGHKDSCDNLLGPPCRNPWRLDRTSGGSSGGAASAVAAGLGPLAHGSDGGGSIRIPAA